MATVRTSIYHLATDHSWIRTEDFEIQVGVAVYIPCGSEGITKQVGVAGDWIYHSTDVTAYVNDIVFLRHA